MSDSPVELVFHLAVDRDVWDNVGNVTGAFGVFLEDLRVNDLEDEDGGVVVTPHEEVAVKVVRLGYDEYHLRYRMSFAEEGDRPVPLPPSPDDKEPF